MRQRFFLSFYVCIKRREHGFDILPMHTESAVLTYCCYLFIQLFPTHGPQGCEEIQGYINARHNTSPLRN